MVNSTGRNGHDNGASMSKICSNPIYLCLQRPFLEPNDDELAAALRLYFAEGLTQENIRKRLKSDLGYSIG